MDFEFAEEERLAVESWRGFIEREIRPEINDYLDGDIPKTATHRLLKMGADFGMRCAEIPESDGRIGLGFFTSGLVTEALDTDGRR